MPAINNFTIAALDSLTPAEMAELPVSALAELQAGLNDARKEIERRSGVLWAELDRRFHARITALLHADGKDTGTKHLAEDGYDVLGEISKKVAWDQQKLLAVIRAMPKKIGDHYAKVELSVAEAKYRAAPPDIRVKLETARTVKPGKPVYKLTPLN